jgi:hypothetical protein
MSTNDGQNRLGKLSVIITIVVGLIAILGFFGIESAQDVGRRTPATQPVATKAPPGTEAPPDTPSPSTTRPADSTQDSRPTRNAYRKTADEICAKWFHEADLVVQSVADEYERFTRILQIHDSLLLEWGAVLPPEGDRARLDEILDGFRSGNREAFAAAEALQAGDDSRYQAARTRAEGYDAAARRRAAATACAYAASLEADQNPIGR